jgi:diguanylate cyclase (GGDEF)-like protein
MSEIKTKRLMAYTASAMYGAAALDGVIEGFLPGDPPFALLPVIVVTVTFFSLITVGPHLPEWALALLGPFGVVLIAYALATTPGAGDGAVLYTLPVLWTSFFYGRPGAVAILGCVAVGHAVAMMLLPPGSVYPGRWVDVMVSVTATAVVVLALEHRNQWLLGRLAAEARTDALTGLLNRRGLAERAQVEMAHCRREGRSIALASFDIDYFKRINDEWGHEVGDQVLSFLGRLLSAESREVDIVARVGGEEFVVLLPGSDARGAEAFAERVRVGLGGTVSEGLPAVRVSVGINAVHEPTDLATISQRADSALYEAKHAGRDRAVTYQDSELCPATARSINTGELPHVERGSSVAAEC